LTSQKYKCAHLTYKLLARLPWEVHKNFSQQYSSASLIKRLFFSIIFIVFISARQWTMTL